MVLDVEWYGLGSIIHGMWLYLPDNLSQLPTKVLNLTETFLFLFGDESSQIKECTRTPFTGNLPVIVLNE